MKSISKYIDSVQIFDRLDIKQIKPSKFNLRRSLGDLKELMSSIAQKGLLQPIVVRPCGDGFEIIAGNRRYEALRRLKWRKAPCIILDVDDKEAYEIAIVENVQRETLDPVEEAMAYKKYVEEYGWGSITELARKIGKSQEYVSHRILLLSLPQSILELISWRRLKPSIAQELVWLKDPKEQEELAKMAVDKNLTVREVRRLVREKRRKDQTPSIYEELEHSSRRKGKLLEKSILLLRITLVRFDSIIKEAEDFPDLKRELMNKRLVIHRMIDELIRLKKRKVSQGPQEVGEIPAT